MMKYIRTKDGRIIDLTDKDYIVNGNDLILHEQYETVSGLPCEKGSMTQLSVAIITKHNEYNFVGTIEKQADTIEELCDCVVYDCLPRPHQSAYHKHEVSDVESLEWNRKPERFENVYGAIWTDKGLIYIAKMNEKGTLELL